LSKQKPKSIYPIPQTATAIENPGILKPVNVPKPIDKAPIGTMLRKETPQLVTLLALLEQPRK
jgi:hypothetical protein